MLLLSVETLIKCLRIALQNNTSKLDLKKKKIMAGAKVVFKAKTRATFSLYFDVVYCNVDFLIQHT